MTVQKKYSGAQFGEVLVLEIEKTKIEPILSYAE